MVSKHDFVFVYDGNEYYFLGRNFSETEEIEEKVQKMFEYDDGEYTYGVMEDFSELGTTQVDEFTPQFSPRQPHENDILESISERCSSDERVENVSVIDENTPTKTILSLGENSVLYKSAEVDLALTFSNDEFDAVPISEVRQEHQEKVRSLVEDIVDTEHFFLGFRSSYASRGRRNPYVRAGIRITRDTDEEQAIYEALQRGVSEIYFSMNNVSSTPIMYDREVATDEYRPNDFLITLTEAMNDDLNSIAESQRDDILACINNLEQLGLQAKWIGKMMYKNTFHYCLGVVYTDKPIINRDKASVLSYK